MSVWQFNFGELTLLNSKLLSISSHLLKALPIQEFPKIKFITHEMNELRFWTQEENQLYLDKKIESDQIKDCIVCYCQDILAAIKLRNGGELMLIDYKV